MNGDEDDELEEAGLTSEEKEALAAIRKKKRMLVEEHRIKKRIADNRPVVPRKFDKDRQFTTDRMGRHLSNLGLDPSAAIERARSRSVSWQGRKRERSNGVEENVDAMDVDQPSKRHRMLSCSKSMSRPPGEVIPGEGFKDSSQKLKAVKLRKKASKKRNKYSLKGEGDRVILNMKPKHLFSGK